MTNDAPGPRGRHLSVRPALAGRQPGSDAIPERLCRVRDPVTGRSVLIDVTPRDADGVPIVPPPRLP